MLTATEVTAMRTTQSATLPDTCTRTRTPLVSDGMGGQKVGTASTASYACRLSTRGVPSQYAAMGAVLGQQLWMVTLPYNADVVAEDVLTIGTQSMRVLGIASGGEWETATRAVCVEVS
jgi:hypothetical protein